MEHFTSYEKLATTIIDVHVERAFDARFMRDYKSSQMNARTEANILH